MLRTRNNADGSKMFSSVAWYNGDTYIYESYMQTEICQGAMSTLSAFHFAIEREVTSTVPTSTCCLVWCQ